MPEKLKLNEISEKEFLENYDPSVFHRISFSVDSVIFGIDSKKENGNYRKLDIQKLSVLLVKRNEHPFINCWSLPGGFVSEKEGIKVAALRILKAKTGIDNLYFEQLKTFGEVDRDPRMRIISAAYLSLINLNHYILKKGDAIDDYAWFEVELKEEDCFLKLSNGEEELKFKIYKKCVLNGKISEWEYSVEKCTPMAFDHPKMILEGLLRLRGKIDYTDIIFNLMPEQFTITQLQQIYEIILGKKLLPAAFRRTIAKKVVETGEFTKDKGHRPSQLFKYNYERS